MAAVASGVHVPGLGLGASRSWRALSLRPGARSQPSHVRPSPSPEETFSSVPGVVKTRVGYTGGDRADPTYASVCAGDGHTEAVKIDFDPTVVSYAKLLDLFMAQHDPCVPMSTQYQSAVWPQNETQAAAVMAAIERVERTRGRPVYTKVEKPKRWYDAEWYHQSYNNKNKARLAAAFGVFVLNNIPHGSFPGQEPLKTVLGGAVFLSLLPQLVSPFDRLLSMLDQTDE